AGLPSRGDCVRHPELQTPRQTLMEMRMPAAVVQARVVRASLLPGAETCIDGRRTVSGTRKTVESALEMAMSFVCSCWGKEHPGPPLAYDVPLPEYVLGIPEVQRTGRVSVDGDLCIVDDEFFFVKGRIQIPVRGTSDSLEWAVWVSVSAKSYARTLEIFY